MYEDFSGVDMEDFFYWTKRVLIPIGLWPLPNKPGIKLLIRSICHSNYLHSVWLLAAELYEIVYNISNVLLITETISLFIVVVSNDVKNGAFLFGRDLLSEMVRLTEELSDHTPVPNTNERIKASSLKWKDRSLTTIKFVFILYFSTIAVFLFIPLVLMYQTGTIIFPFPSKFPYDTTQMKYYVPTYVFQVILGFLTAWTCAGAETYFASIVMFVCSRIEVLKYSIETATHEAITQNRTTPLFGRCVEYHKQILKLSGLLESLYSFGLILQFVCSTLAICMISFLLIQENTSIENRLKFSMFSASVFTQLFIYCSLGQLLEIQFETLIHHGTHCAWYIAPLCYQKNIKFYMARCHIRSTLTAYKIMPVNIKTFFSIFKTSISYITVLQSMQEKTAN